MTRIPRFEDRVMPHLDAAYNLARRLTRNDHDAQDVVQEGASSVAPFRRGIMGTYPISLLPEQCSAMQEMGYVPILA